jgi:REase associating with pPIWI_RE/pPIWI_RE three-gene island domain Y
MFTLSIIDERRSVVTTAALRSAVAWSRRADEPRAWREVARMTGVIMGAFSPGAGPVTPSQLVAFLRRPLCHLLPHADEPSPLDGVILLDAEDRLTDGAMDIACDYNHVLFHGRDPASDWLPGWAWQRGEQVERLLFQSLIQSGSQKAYEASRRFVIERPAGVQRALTDERTTAPEYAGARLVTDYKPVPADRVYRFGGGDADECWWPCPVCRWPMRIQEAVVSCAYSPHQAVFRITAAGGPAGSRPVLAKTSGARLRVPDARPTGGSTCVDLAVWRFITVPGITEVLLERRLRAIPGVGVQMWPVTDAYDLLVTAPDGHPWRVDVKDHVSPAGIPADPPAAEYVVVPAYRKGQVNQLRRMLPDRQVQTIDQFVSEVREYAGTKRAK